MRLLYVVAYFALVRANYFEFLFASHGPCPGESIDCAPPAVCAHDALTDKWYCCSGSWAQQCIAYALDCLGANATDPSSVQQLCVASENKWCCLSSEYEVCTPREGTINTCIATQPDIFANVSGEMLNKTYSSLLSADPTATAFTFDGNSLASAVASPATTSSAVTTSSTGTTASSSPQSAVATTSSTVQNGGMTISGGGIAGIVIGTVLGTTAVLAGAYFFLRMRRHRSSANQVNKPAGQEFMEGPHVALMELGTRDKEPVELQNRVVRRELDAEITRLRGELSGESRQL